MSERTLMKETVAIGIDFYGLMLSRIPPPSPRSSGLLLLFKENAPLMKSERLEGLSGVAAPKQLDTAPRSLADFSLPIALIDLFKELLTSAGG